MPDAASSYISETEVEEFTRIVRESRDVLIRNDAAMIAGMDDLLSRVAENMRQAIRDTPRGLLGLRFQREALANLERVQDAFRDEYRQKLDAGILANAKLAVQREQDIQTVLMRTRTGQTPEVFADLIQQNAKQSVQFGQVPREVLERLYARTYGDGLNLHNRLVVLDEQTRKAVSEAVFESVANGEGVRKMTARIAPIMEQQGISNTRYKAQRIARTETNLAYREGHVASATDENGELHPWISGIGWRLSPAHPRPDICFRVGTRVETIDGPVPIEDVKEGDLVRTHTGKYQAVIHLHRNTFSGSLLRLCFQAERSRTLELIVTPNHPVLTEEGWLRADALKMGCRARSLPSMLAAPYVPLKCGRIDRALRSFAGSWRSRLLRSSGAGLCGERCIRISGRWYSNLREWIIPTWKRDIESGSGKVSIRRRSSDFPDPYEQQTSSAETLQFAAGEGRACASVLRRPFLHKMLSSILQTWRDCCSRTTFRNTDKSASDWHGRQDNREGSSISSWPRTLARRKASRKSDKPEMTASSSQRRNTDDYRSDALQIASGVRSHAQQGQVRRGNIRRFVECLSYIYYTLRRGKGTSATLTKIENIATSDETVFNLEVANDHTYFAEGISVHNCDYWASDDSDGLGEGNYEPSNVPPGHPCCLCMTVSILASMPDQQFVSKQPDSENVPRSQLKYYGFMEED